MTRVIYQPCANKDSKRHYEDTVANPVDLATVDDLLSTDQRGALHALSVGGLIALWGVTPGRGGSNTGKFAAVQPGDLVVLTGDGRAFATAVVTYKMHNPALASRLWGHDPNGLTWENMYALDNVTEVSISYGDTSAVVGDSPIYGFQGFRVLNQTASDAFIDAFASAEPLGGPGNEVISTELPLAGGPLTGAVDGHRSGSVRRDSQVLRSRLLGNRRYAECHLCGRAFPAQFLVAAHIKRRSVCSDAEKRDADNVVMLACVLGCDMLYENGLISVGNGQDIMASPRLSEPGYEGLEAYASAHLVDKRYMGTWSERRAEYFEWHRDVRFVRPPARRTNAAFGAT